MAQTHDRRAEARELGKRIRAAQADSPVEVPLSTSQRIIARVTDGIYREPWAAFRELCANAYDADATEVVIETGAPSFDQVVIRDNGRGMSPDTLAWVVQNIGGSSKRTADGVALHTASAENPDYSIDGRPLIGKIGIGLFAVAQLTQHFQIITKVAGEDFRTWATVVLQTHNESALKESSDKTWIAGTASIVSEKVVSSEVDAHGTTIVLHDLRPEIRSLLQSAPRWLAERESGPNGESMVPAPRYHIGRTEDARRKISFLPPELPWSNTDGPLEKFKGLLRVADELSGPKKTATSLEHLDEYLQSIWKLSLALPLAYIEDHPFEISGADGLIVLGLPKVGPAFDVKLEERETLRGHFGLKAGNPDPAGGFDIYFDGILLRRPIALSRTIARASRIPSPVIMAAKVEAPFSDSSLGRAGGSLSFEAYLYWNSTITPKDIQGVLIRVRNASGTLFDRRFLNYQVSEQTRLSQITAEIFVTDGLDGAINIDRESFNYSHPHYIFIKKWVHRALRLLINRLKSIAKEDLDAAKSTEILQTRAAVVESALQIWTSEQGVEADLPTVMAAHSTSAQATYKVDHWLDDIPESDRAVATAVAVVLEAYGLTDTLSQSKQGAIVRDILRIFSVGR